jgi:hypothetical protein
MLCLTSFVLYNDNLRLGVESAGDGLCAMEGGDMQSDQAMRTRIGNNEMDVAATKTESWQ